MASLTTVETSYGSGSRPLGPLTWAALRAMDTSGLHVGDFVEVSDLGYSHWVWNGTLWRPRAPVLLGASAVAAAVTGTTAETVLATVTVPAGAMGPSGGLEIRSSWTVTNSANSKTLRTRLGGLAGSQFQTLGLTTVVTAADVRRIRNRGNAASQVGSAPANASGINVGSGSAHATAAVDTSVAQDLVLTGTLALATESITLESREVWLLP